MPQNYSALKQKEWYKKWWGIIIAFVFLLPFGLWYIWFKADWSKKVKIVATAGLVILAIIGFLALSSKPSLKPNNSASTQVESKKTDTKSTNKPSVGDEAYLRLPNTSDSEQIIQLAYDKNGYDELSKALFAKDTGGIFELGKQGKIFGVSNGSKVLIIDSEAGSRKVRILKGVRPIDDDKVDLTGWVVYEFLVK